jgi:hypothetical protein
MFKGVHSGVQGIIGRKAGEGRARGWAGGAGVGAR